MAGPGWWRARAVAQACRMAVRRFLRWGDRAELDAALGCFARVPEDYPERAEVAWTVLDAALRGGLFAEPDYVVAASELADILDAAPAAQPPEWALTSATVHVMALAWVASTAPPPGFSYDQAVFRAGEWAETLAPTNPELAVFAELVQLNLRLQAGPSRSTFSGLRLIAAGRDEWERRLNRVFDGAGAPGVIATETAAATTALAELVDARGNADATAAAMERLSTILPRLLAAVMEARSTSAASDAAWDASRIGGVSVLEHVAAEASESLQRVRPEDPASYDRAASQWEDAVRMAEDEGEDDWLLWAEAADAHLRRALEGARRDDDVQRSIELYERAVEAAATYARFPWSRVTLPLSIAYRLADRYEDAVRVAWQGLRGNAWNALLENDAEDAHAAVLDAARDAVRTARLMLSEDDAAGAAAALEAGRGLIVTAATQTTDMVGRLVRADRPDLAEQWARALSRGGAGDVPADLRLRAVAALAGVRLRADGSVPVPVTEAGAGLLRPPSAAELRAGLGRLGADALIYLVASNEEEYGFALVVPAVGEPSSLLLPNIEAEGARIFEKLVFALSREARDLGLDPGLPHPPASYLAGYADWLWREAVGPLFAHLASRHALTGSRDAPLRLVLVPMQELALLPWHAASHQEGGRTVYALEHAVFSYAASGRLLCECAQRAGLPLDGSGIVVGDPDTQGRAPALPGARMEAAAIHEAFYPTAAYLGRRPNGQAAPGGSGTAAEVAGWLAGASGAGRGRAGRGGAMMHLACHGAVDVESGRADSSYLLLDGGVRLSAEEMVGAPGATLDGIGLAVLAACSTAKSGRGYDEAFNLGTVLLARGVRGVISAQWPVADAETSVLMFMLHHYLRVENLRPAEAVRAAQLWMIRDRRPPDSMPAALRARFAAVDEVRVAAWAGFVHAGR